MAYRVVVNGLTIECDTVDEVKALAGIEMDAPPKKKHENEEISVPAAGKHDNSAIKLLRILVSNQEHGVHVDTLVKALDLKGGRGMGPFTTAVKGHLAKIGMNEGDVMRIVRTTEGRRYYATERTAEALRKIGEQQG